MKYRLGDTVKRYKPADLDFSPEAQQKLLVDVLTGKAPEEPFDLVTLTTQEMVDEYNERIDQ